MHGEQRRTRHVAMPTLGVGAKHALHRFVLRQQNCSTVRRWKSWSRIESDGAPL